MGFFSILNPVNLFKGVTHAVSAANDLAKDVITAKPGKIAQDLQNVVAGNDPAQLLSQLEDVIRQAVSEALRAQQTDKAPAAPSGPTAGDPSTWTDNNAPYGVTLAGFSPQNHTDLTKGDLASVDPASVSKNAKYLVYNYFLENKTQPTKDWAPAAADQLNARYQTNIFHAIDGETLGYGDEYVHSAPNGYGMPRGTYNPNASGELFWGSTGS